MSVHSAQRSQQPNAALSHQNNLNHSMSPHSLQNQQPPIASPHQEWVAAYIDGQYYLTDPESIHRLKNIEAEIQQERDKLDKMAKQQNQNQSLSNSFISAPEDRAERHSNHSFCGTEFNQHRQTSKREKVKNELEKEEDRYRQKIRNMEKQKSEMKKGMKQVEETQQPVAKEAEEAKSHRKSSRKEEVEGERKTVQKSERPDSKEKSYHKSRIQNSIKKNLDLNLLVDLQSKPMEQQKSKKSQRIENRLDRSATPVEGSHQHLDLLAPASVKGKKGENASVKHSQINEHKSVKQSQKQQQILEHEAKQSGKPSEKQAHSIREHSKKGNFSKNQQLQGEQNQQNEAIMAKSEHQGSRAQSKKETEKNSTLRKQSERNQKSVRNEQESIKVKVIAVESIDSSKVRQSQQIKSIKSNNSRLIEQPVDIPTPKGQSIHQEKTKSVKSHLQAESKVSGLSQEEEKMLQSGVASEAKSKSHAPQSRKSSVAKEQDLKSKKSQMQKEQVRSRKPSANKQQDAKSKRSQALNPVSIPFIFDDGKSKKSAFEKGDSRKVQEQVRSKRSSVQPVLQEKVFVHDEEVKSKKSSIIDSVHRSRVDSIKQAVAHHQKETKAKQQLRSQKESSQRGKEVSQSGQWSRAIESNANNANAIKFEKSSAKNSSSIQQNEQSMNESSHLKLQQLNNELVQEQVQRLDVPSEANMRKRKESENQSEKKSRSFIIHSRGGSVKERSQKLSVNKGKFSSKKEVSSVQGESVTKEEISKLQEQVGMLREKLMQIEQRQEQMEKVEINFSKTHSGHIEEKQEQNVVNASPVDQQKIEELEVERAVEQPAESNPLAALLGELVKGTRAPARLQLQSSIIQVNTQEQLRKKVQKESEASEKVKLTEQISRLKRIIRDMQIQKIKSIDHDIDLGESGLLKKESRSFADSQAIRNSRIGGESVVGLEGMQTQKRFWGKSRQEEAGRIIKNSFLSEGLEDISPRRGSQRIKFAGNEEDVVMDPDELPSQSNSKRSSKFRKEAQQLSLIERIHDKERDFHHFVESSHVFAEEPMNEQVEGQQEPTGLVGFQQFSKISVGNPANNSVEGKMNYSRMVEQFRKNNPQEEQVLPQIHMRDIKIPQLPPTPSPQLAQQELLALAKQTYQIFGMNVEQEDRQLCVKKYKNCVFFTLSSCPDAILWHFSGKFYMGGWRVGEPGEGEKHGEGLQVVPDKHVYRGQFLNGKKNGTGILKLANGNIYDGQWIDGAKNGRGVYFDAATRVLFSGEWKDGRKDGQGFLKLSDKEYYHGTFVRSVKQGFGSEVFVNGDRYRGEYHGGKFHGKGKYTWANGSCYQGQFVEGVRQGQGSWKSAKNNGDVYVGSYENDKKNGYGRYVWANGCMFQGGFANDVKHGKGRLTYQDGKEIKGVWEEGNLITTQNEKRPADHQEQPLRRSVKVASFGGYHPATARRF